MTSLRSLTQFLESFDFVSMQPDGGFVISGIDPKTHYRGMSQHGAQYALYIHHSEGGDGGSYTVTPENYQEILVLDLPAGNYNAEWIDPASEGVISAQKFTAAGDTQNLKTPAYSTDIALRMNRQ